MKQEVCFTNKKLFAIISIVLIINLTPACALNLSAVQNNSNYINNYAHAGFWYKFWHFFEFSNAVSSLISQLTEAAKEIPSYTLQGLDISNKAMKSRNELDIQKEELNDLSRYYENDSDKSNWADDGDEPETTHNQINNSLNSTKNTTQLNKPNIISNSQNISQNKPQTVTQNIKEKENLNNTNVTKKASNAPQKLIDHANNTKNQLKSHGIEVNVGNRTITNLKPGKIVQLVDPSGYIKYMEYLGKINNFKNGTQEVKLYNGDKYLNIPYTNFKNAYTGVILELTSNNDLGVTTEDAVFEIYSLKLNSLNTNSNYFSNWSEIGSFLSISGGIVSAISAIISFISGGVAIATSETGVIAVLAIIVATIAVLFTGMGAFITALGLVITTTCNRNAADINSERTDLTSAVV